MHYKTLNRLVSTVFGAAPPYVRDLGGRRVTREYFNNYHQILCIVNLLIVYQYLKQ